MCSSDLGIATFVQCRRFGPFGAGLLIVQGTSFNFVGPLIAGGTLMVKQGTPVEAVMAAIFGVVVAGSFIEMGVSRILPFIRPWARVMSHICDRCWHQRRHLRRRRGACHLREILPRRCHNARQ